MGSFQTCRIYSLSVAGGDSADWQLRVEIANFMQHGQIYMRVLAVIEVLITVVGGGGEQGDKVVVKRYRNQVQASYEVQLTTKCFLLLKKLPFQN